MNHVKETGIQICLVAVFGISVLSSALWMSGAINQESFNLSNLKQLSPIDKKLKNHMSEQIVFPEHAKQDEYKAIHSYAEEDSGTDQAEDGPVSEMSGLGNKETIAVSTVSQIEQLDIGYDLRALEADINLTQYEIQTVLATGYTAGYESTGKNPDHPEFGITYSGVKVRRDLYSTIAADINIFPIGTILYIPNYGYGVVADIGGAIKGHKIDLYFETVEDVYRLWGKQDAQVYVIEKGTGELSEAYLDQLNKNQAIEVYKPKK